MKDAESRSNDAEVSRLPAVRDHVAEGCGQAAVAAAVRTPRATPRAAKAPKPQLADVWRVVVLNDPVNRMSYVVMVLRRVFGFAEERARKHMLEVHEKGRSVLWSGTREQAEAYVFALQQWHLTAVVQADEAG